jgi:hypothetical protein
MNAGVVDSMHNAAEQAFSSKLVRLQSKVGELAEQLERFEGELAGALNELARARLQERS